MAFNLTISVGIPDHAIHAEIHRAEVRDTALDALAKQQIIIIIGAPELLHLAQSAENSGLANQLEKGQSICPAFRGPMSVSTVLIFRGR